MPHPIRIKTSDGWQDIAPGGPVPAPVTPTDDGKWLQAVGGVAVWSTLPTTPTHFAGVSPGKIVSDDVGVSGNYTNANCPLVLYKDAALTIPFQFTVTPTVDCWWELHAQMMARVTDAAWYRHEGLLRLMNSTRTAAKADALGATVVKSAVAHHNGAGDWAPHLQISALWALIAGQTYSCDFVVGYITAGTWNNYRWNDHLQLHNRGARPRY